MQCTIDFSSLEVLFRREEIVDGYRTIVFNSMSKIEYMKEIREEFNLQDCEIVHVIVTY